MGAAGPWQMVTGLNIDIEVQEQAVGQPAVMAWSAEPCWEHCPGQGEKEERLKYVCWDVGIVQVGCSELLGCAEECTGMGVTTFDTHRPQSRDSCVIYQMQVAHTVAVALFPHKLFFQTHKHRSDRTCAWLSLSQGVCPHPKWLLTCPKPIF